jgi:excisionase family DNA binding protein
MESHQHEEADAMLCPTCGCPKTRWLRVETVAKQFGCSAKKVRRLLHQGELEGVRLGREWRVDHKSLDRLVRRHSLSGGLGDARPSSAG